jgi:anti-anti-sigma factor
MDEVQNQRLTVAVESDDGTVRIRPEGEIDLATAPQLERAIGGLDGYARIVVDLRDVTFMDSSGLRLLIGLDAAARRDGWTLMLRPGRQSVQRVFEVTGMDRHLPFE